LLFALPVASYFLDIPYAPAKSSRKTKSPVALATDFNPGSSTTENIQLVMSPAVPINEYRRNNKCGNN
jgi:imidazolonepropionase